MTDKELLQKYKDYCIYRSVASSHLFESYEFWEQDDEFNSWQALIEWGYYKTQCNHILDSLNYRDYERLCDLAGSIV